VLRRISLAGAAKLAHSPSFLLFLLAASMIQASHALYYAFGTLHWRAQGFADGTIGALWALGVIAEIALFAVSGNPRQVGRRQSAVCRWRRSFGSLGADGLRSAALGDGTIAMPARHELWSRASRRDLFLESGRA